MKISYKKMAAIGLTTLMSISSVLADTTTDNLLTQAADFLGQECRSEISDVKKKLNKKFDEEIAIEAGQIIVDDKENKAFLETILPSKDRSSVQQLAKSGASFQAGIVTSKKDKRARKRDTDVLESARDKAIERLNKLDLGKKVAALIKKLRKDSEAKIDGKENIIWDADLITDPDYNESPHWNFPKKLVVQVCKERSQFSPFGGTRQGTRVCSRFDLINGTLTTNIVIKKSGLYLELADLTFANDGKDEGLLEKEARLNWIYKSERRHIEGRLGRDCFSYFNFSSDNKDYQDHLANKKVKDKIKDEQAKKSKPEERTPAADKSDVEKNAKSE